MTWDGEALTGNFFCEAARYLSVELVSLAERVVDERCSLPNERLVGVLLKGERRRGEEERERERVRVRAMGACYATASS